MDTLFNLLRTYFLNLIKGYKCTIQKYLRQNINYSLKFIIMKSTFLLFFLFFIGATVVAQNGISFQGIARDPQGNAITGQTISVKFTIGSFSETQNINTDNFGVFSTTIGSVNTNDFNNLVFANMTDNLKVEVDGTIIYDDKFNTVPYAKSAENGVPPGSIMPFAGPANKVPAGWLLCNGSSKAKTGMYQKLFDAIGTAWGDDGGNFRVPDLRGMFLRGTNEGRTGTYADPINRNVGDLQTDLLKSHNHNGSTSTNGSHTHNASSAYRYLVKVGVNTGGGGFDTTAGEPTLTSAQAIQNAGNHSHTISSDGGVETRPKNAAVVYIIKY